MALMIHFAPKKPCILYNSLLKITLIAHRISKNKKTEVHYGRNGLHKERLNVGSNGLTRDEYM